MDSATSLALIAAVLAPLVLALISGIRWLFVRMEARLQKEIEELRGERRILQAKVDQMLFEAIQEQRALVSAYQRNSEVNRQILGVVDDNIKVLDTNTKALEKITWKP